ncbi:MAG: lipase maturation factor family protein [Acidobacteriota bacterium]
MMERRPTHLLRWLFDSRRGPTGHLIPRGLFLRALAAIYFSAFFSLLFQIKGLLGPEGILPAHQYLALVAHELAGKRYWFAPTLFWFSSTNAALMTVTWIGLIAAVAAFCNLWPRLSFSVCFVCFLAFVTATGAFSEYQSDGMLLEAGLLALFFAPSGLLPGWAAEHPPIRASLWLLQWEWFRIYFESGLVKLLSGDPEWRHFTAMDEYYQNGPLPTWIGWYAQHLPHGFQVFTAGATLAMELGIVCLLFFPRRVRLICFFIVTPWEIGVILTANYAFLNYLVLALGILLLDDRFLRPLLPARFRPAEARIPAESRVVEELPLSILAAGDATEPDARAQSNATPPGAPGIHPNARESAPPGLSPPRKAMGVAGLSLTALLLAWVAYDTTAELIDLAARGNVMPASPIALLEPFRIANQYGLFAVMTRGRYEIEFQGSNDGQTWIAYPFRYKPQALNQPPGIYAPYQPRFDWNLWFASLGDWQQNEMVPLTEERLLQNDRDVLALFAGNPFPQAPPRYVRAVLWQYWFTSMQEKRGAGNWWRRSYIGLYAPELTPGPDGRFEAVTMPEPLPPHD